MNMVRWSATFMALAGLAAAPGLRAEDGSSGPSRCAARFDRVGLQGTPRYLPFSGVPTDIPLEVTTTGHGPCRIGLGFRSAGDGRLRGSGASLSYRLQGDGGRVVPLDGVALIGLPPSSSATGPSPRLVLSLPPDQAVRAGRYGDRLIVRLFDGQQVLDEREVEIGVEVQSQASLSLAGTAQSGFSRAHGAGLDFGQLASGKEREALLFVLSNAAYALTFTSLHHGRLRRVPDGPASESIAYTASLDGAVLDLAGAAMVRSRARDPIPLATPYRLGVRIGDVAGRTAGEYRDIITVDLMLLE